MALLTKLILVTLLIVILVCSTVFWLLSVILHPNYAGWQPISPWRCISALLLPALIVYWGIKRRSLDSTGALAAFLVGFILTLASFCFMSAMLAFFMTASKATKFRSNQKRQIEEDHREGGQRNWIQVLCNGGIAVQLALLYMIETGVGERAIYFSHDYMASWYGTAVLGALACSSGDTYASELGSVLARGDPKLIITGQKVPRGTNGGITMIGLLVSALGGAVVGLAYYIALIVTVEESLLLKSPPQWPIILLASIMGFLGSVIDSLLGALFQYSGINRKTGCVVEYPGPHVDYISGTALLDNHSVNLISALLTAILTPKFAISVWSHYQVVLD